MGRRPGEFSLASRKQVGCNTGVQVCTCGFFDSDFLTIWCCNATPAFRGAPSGRRRPSHQSSPKVARGLSPTSRGRPGGSWAILGPSWGHPEGSWAMLGPSWGHPGTILGHLEALVGPSPEHPGATLDHLGAVSGPSWPVLGPS